ncbi:Esterase/lipase/thioesterase [Mycena sanguinolenta]|uniref:Esterase/lipase/thioesterase n=1 Tax=Mycena sanguinolenta TaxID=230812 RepID=A0A8H7CNI5_9AGAR|nr:Esterase/lipase/thioesterase [Mycena sanguinolenta]
MSQYAHLSEPDPELPNIPRNRGPLSLDSIPTLRHAMSANVIADRTSLPPDSAYTVENRTIAVEGRTQNIRSWCSSMVEVCFTHFLKFVAESKKKVELVPPGWVGGDLDAEDVTLRVLSVELRLAIANVDYRLAPEHPFPVGLNDCYAAVKWTAENCNAIRGSLTKGFIVGGTSAGGNLASAVAHRAAMDPLFRKAQDHWTYTPKSCSRASCSISAPVRVLIHLNTYLNI